MAPGQHHGPMRLDQGVLRQPSLADALVPLATLALLIGGSLALFGLDALDGPVQVALVLCAGVAALVAVKNGHAWSEVQVAGQGAMASVTSAVFILLAVGALIGTWNLSGTIPTLVYYGIQVLSPGWYYAADRGHLCRRGAEHRQLVDDGRHDRRRPRRHRDDARRLPGDHGRCGHLRCVPGRQDLTAVGDHHPDRADGRRWTSTPTSSARSGRPCRRSSSRSPCSSCSALAHVARDRGHRRRRRPSSTRSSDDLLDHARSTCSRWSCWPILSIRKVPASLALMASALFAGALGAFLQPDVVRRLRQRHGQRRGRVDQGRLAGDGERVLDIDTGHPRGRPAAVPRRHGLHAAHPLADLRRGDLRRRCWRTSA